MLSFATENKLAGVANLTNVQIGEERVALLTPYYGISLEDWLAGRRKAEQIPGILGQILDAMELLAGYGYRHGDIDIQNICLDMNNVATLTSLQNSYTLTNTDKTLARLADPGLNQFISENDDAYLPDGNIRHDLYAFGLLVMAADVGID